MGWSYSGRTALITGASSGIGAEFATTLAQRGCAVILVARTAERLQQLAEKISASGGTAHVIPHDLTELGTAQRLLEEVTARGLTVDLLVNNAGFGTYGRFETISPEREREEVQLNVQATVEMCHAFIPGMLQRSSGAVINMSSTSSFQPTPYLAVYGATKAFILSFSEALWAEYRGRGVRVVAVCPGPVETPFFDVMGSDEWLPPWGKLTTTQVVEAGLRALERDRSYVVVGKINYIQALSSRFGSRRLVARISKFVLRPRRR